ncbi:MAG: 5'-methylthioadenosine/adenosylhomocysteine nucleosidase [Treponema sp.]|jgi:adenosylhomocysteine nucleosidase|nr:5'-methylthioadenosine/adenosylhomocysteine nucleosidase [Treponema sp.]
MIGIIGAMEDEVSLLCETMEKHFLQEIGRFEFHTGKIEGKDVTILRCGIGKVNAAVGCALLIQQFNPACIINTGSAGGIHPELKIGDAIISTGLVYYDVDVTAFNYLPGQLPGQPQIYMAEENLIKMAEDAVEDLKKEKILPENFNHKRGLIGSGDTFMHEAERIEKVRRLFPNIAAVEMEGAAIAHCCHLFSIPFVVIRSLSDIAGAESPMSFEEFLSIASKNSANIVMRIVKNKKPAV